MFNWSFTGYKRECKGEAIFEVAMAEDFSEFLKGTNPQYQKLQWISNKIEKIRKLHLDIAFETSTQWD